jgi:hypothetical protein
MELTQDHNIFFSSSLQTTIIKTPALKESKGEKHVKKPKIWKNDTHSVRMT